MPYNKYYSFVFELEIVTGFRVSLVSSLGLLGRIERKNICLKDQLPPLYCKATLMNFISNFERGWGGTT